MTLIGEIISRIKNLVKGIKPDAFLTDRLIYSLLLKHGKWMIKREDGINKLRRISSIFTTLGFVELIDVDKVQENCTGLASGCSIKRTKDKLPTMIDGYFGPLIRFVTTLDGSQEFEATHLTSYINISKQKTYKYNKKKYFWIDNGYMYFPNMEWDAVRIEALIEDKLSEGCDCCEKTEECTPKQEQPYNFPEYLQGEIEARVIQDLAPSLQIPQDNKDDKQNILR